MKQKMKWNQRQFSLVDWNAHEQTFKWLTWTVTAKLVHGLVNNDKTIYITTHLTCVQFAVQQRKPSNIPELASIQQPVPSITHALYNWKKNFASPTPALW